jgi:hypothetical protein
VNLAKPEIARGIDADKEKIGVIRMEGNEVSNVSLKTSDLLASRIERVNQADLISGFGAVRVTSAQRQRQC